MAKLIATEIVDVFTKDGTLLCSLDASNPSAAAREFGKHWHDGLIERVTHLESGSPTMTKEELSALAGRAWKDERVRFERRYLDGDKIVHPEGGDVRHTPLSLKVQTALGNLAERAWKMGWEHIQQTTEETRKQLASTDYERYVQGLEKVRQIDAAGQLKSAILNMSDEAGKKQMKAEFPELFSNDAMSELAQARSHESDMG